MAEQMWHTPREAGFETNHTAWQTVNQTLDRLTVVVHWVASGLKDHELHFKRRSG
jgi:hypothetical protein